jgi:hypothetical protein
MDCARWQRRSARPLKCSRPAADHSPGGGGAAAARGASPAPEAAPVCRTCWETEDEGESGPLVAPCACSGSMVSGMMALCGQRPRVGGEAPAPCAAALPFSPTRQLICLFTPSLCSATCTHSAWPAGRRSCGRRRALLPAGGATCARRGGAARTCRQLRRRTGARCCETSCAACPGPPCWRWGGRAGAGQLLQVTAGCGFRLLHASRNLAEPSLVSCLLPDALPPVCYHLPCSAGSLACWPSAGCAACRRGWKASAAAPAGQRAPPGWTCTASPAGRQRWPWQPTPCRRHSR